ncbi:hypothetical protein SAMN05443287_104470 [Micromonospora phaseoli]|uniref:Uncharacterized protein n=1 Tax=Micromonospora phaseoli TaxID=1144548 RepID=A0A1H6Z661_9ACTN|nr:hypothetical protein [Micromonospora phaseoli]PZW00440.1 hypothetical protein CLV64_103469 [Micromonospora phaseoli]GIJ76920.1 hypothetical protein Xph01_13520 [Micromonospora phaseoli]SEJ45112.1 hypothetical protein SAMN05443287_104470 [Micromonospora phaseoli]
MESRADARLERRAPGRDWRDTVRDAADLALLGILTVLAAAPVLTAGAAVGTASAAVHDWLTTGSWPTARRTVSRFGRGLLPGLPVALIGLAAVGLLAADLAALATGRVPGGAVALSLTTVVAAGLLGYAAAIVVEVGRTGGIGWRSAAIRAARVCLDHPGQWAGLAGTTVVATLLGVLVTPVAVPILAGYLLAAVHAVARRRPVVRAELS